MYRIILCVAMALFVTAFAFAAESGPRIMLDPDTAKSGEKITVYGFGFCGAEECSVVRVELEEEAVAEEVRVGPDGNFAVSIETVAPPGLYDVLAIQEIGEDGERTDTAAELTLGVGEQKPGGRRPIPR